MKTLVIDAIVGIGFPTLTLALTAEQGRLATFRDGPFGNGGHVWRREALAEIELEELQAIYTGLRAEREMLATQQHVEQIAPPAGVLASAGMH